MNIAEALEVVIASAKHQLEKQALEGRVYEVAYATIAGWRGHEPIGLARPQAHERDVILHLVRLFAGGFGCDIVATSFDSFMSATPDLNPHTGKKWEPGQMQDLADNHQGREKGWVLDALMVTVVNRAGDLRVATLPYSFVGDQLRWDEPVIDDPEVDGKMKFTGLVPDKMVEAMMMPTLDVATAGLIPQFFPGETTFEQQRARLDGTLVKMLPKLMGGHEHGDVQLALFLDPSNRERFDVLRKILPTDARLRKPKD